MGIELANIVREYRKTRAAYIQGNVDIKYVYEVAIRLAEYVEMAGRYSEFLGNEGQKIERVIIE